MKIQGAPNKARTEKLAGKAVSAPLFARLSLLAFLTILAASGASAEATGKAPPEWGDRVNWQAWARTTTIPAMHSAAFLTDGDTATFAQFTVGGEAGADLRIAFPKPFEVKGLRLVQKRPAASHFQIWADLDGSGAYTNIIADKRDEKAVIDEWIEIPVGRTVAGLRLSFLAGEVGYRNVFPRLAELEIYGSEHGTTLPAFEGGPIVATLGAKSLPRLDGKPLTDIRICTDWWNWGMEQWEDANAKLKMENEKSAAGATPISEIALKDWEPYKRTVGQLKELGATSVRMFAESEACGANGGFSSFPLEGLPADQQHDWLAPLAKQLHADGYPIYYFSHAWRAPIQKIGAQPPNPWLRWDYPYMASDALVGINEHYTNWYPCVLSDRDFRDKWTALLRGALKAGADGVYLCPDEYFYKGHNLSRCTCESCRKAFEARFGFCSLPALKPPKAAMNAQGQVAMLQPADTEQFRKYKVFEYERLANLFHGIGADLRKEFPGAKLVMNENQGAVGNSNGRLEHTVANDLFGNGAEYDEKQIYGGGTMCVDAPFKHVVFAKHFEAACGGADRLLSSAGWGPANLGTPTEQYNSVLPEVFVGAGALEIYRLNYIFMGGASSVWKNTLNMVRLLDAWGLRDSAMPADIGFVYSRSSEDWWQVKIGSRLDPSIRSAATDFHLHLADESVNKIAEGADTPERTRILSNERFRGWGAQNAVESLIAAGGFPYRVLYAERPDNMKDLSRFRVLVIPFAYSLSRAAADAIRAAHAAGTKLVIFEHLAPTDEFGTPYDEPLLKDLVGQDGVIFVEGSASDTSADLGKLREYAGILAKANADSGYYFHASENLPVTYLVRELNGGQGWLLYLCNTAATTKNPLEPAKRARAVIGLPAENGTYGMETFSSDTCDVTENAIDGKTAIHAEALHKFQIDLDPQEVKIVRIFRISNQSPATLPPGYLMTREPPVEAGKANLAPYADCIATDVFEARLRAPVDGSLGTRQSGAFRLDFPVPVSVDEIAITMPQSEVLVYADCDGDGVCERPLVEIADAPAFGTWDDIPEYVWYVKKFEKPVVAKSFFVPTGAWEIRVFGDASQIAKLPARKTLPPRPALVLGGRKDYPVPADADRLRFGFTLEPWMFGAQSHFAKAFETGEPPPPVAEWPEWKSLMKDFDYYSANFILLFPPSTFSKPKAAVEERGSYPFPLLWPSSVWYLNQPHDVLRDFHDACHANDIESFVIPREWSFGDQPTDHPKQVVLAEEIAQRGADGVPACFDEQVFGFGLERFGNTPDFRTRYLAKAAEIAGWMSQIKEVAAKANPNALTFGGYAGCDHYRQRYDCMSGCDIWGFDGKVDVIGGDGTYYGVGIGDGAPLGTFIPAVETAVQLACTPKRLSMATLNCNWGTKWVAEEKRLRNPLVYDDYPSTAFKAGPLVTFFNKGTYANFWRYNYIFGNGGPACREATAVGGRLVKLLSAWGGKKASIPKDVLVLRSRTSEDWWSLAHHDNPRMRELGFTLFFWTAARLCENAVPFEIYPMHRPETWHEIAKDYKAIVLLFAYAVSDEEAAALKAAADAGVTILAPGTYPLGAVDKTGEARSAVPALDGVPLVRLPFEPVAGQSTSALANAFAAQLRKALDAHGGPSLTLNREPDHDVQAYRLDAPDGAALVLVVNWSERNTEADISVALPFAEGTLEVATEDGLYDAPFAPAIRLALPREAVRLLRFAPQRCRPRR